MKCPNFSSKYPKTPVFDHSNYRLFERIHAVPGTSNNRGLTVYAYCRQQYFLKACTCYRVNAVAYILVNHEFLLLNVFFQINIEK